MLYQSELELPRDVRDVLPTAAQDLYRRAYNQAWRAGRTRSQRDRDLAAHAAAWRQVKASYVKNIDGEWVSRNTRSQTVEDL